MKLLAKTAEERYQTAAGVEHDLRRCLAAWETQRRIDAFPLGAHDTPDRLLIPEKLYGRAREVETLLAAFDRVVTSGAPELVLVSGYAGIGKSSVVNELHKALVPPRGLFASGKFDQYKRDIPYATLAQAFQSLIRCLLAKSEADLAPWREALLEALGPNGRLMVDLVPELRLLIGDQPPVPELPPQDAQRRFQLVLRRFLGVFARPEHPLALFLDDLQWLDAATLDLVEHLLTQPDVRHLMLIGAYRDNEVDAAHPLRRKLDAIRQAGALVQEISLAPLARDDVEQLMAEALRCEPARAAPLAQLVHEKTGGNPFFVMQFISALADEGLLTFDHVHARWSWDLERIHAKGYTENVVDLMVAKLSGLPVETQKALQQLACLGNVADVTILSIVLGTSEAQVHADLSEAVRLELVERLAGSYTFVHDRVQEAAYALIPEASRAEAHLRIGRLLAAQTPVEKREEAIFEIVNQLNRGVPLDHIARRARAAGRAEPASGPARQGIDRLRLGAHLSHRWRGTAGGGLLGAPARQLMFALELHPGRMRSANRRDGRRGAPLDEAVNPRRHDRRTGDRRLCAHGCVHVSRSERPRRGRWSRLFAPCGHRLVAASDRRGCTTRIRAHLGPARWPRHRGAPGAAPDDRPGIPRHARCADQARAVDKVHGCEPVCLDHLHGSTSQPRARQQRWVVLRLCTAGHGRRRALRRLSGRLSLRSARL